MRLRLCAALLLCTVLALATTGCMPLESNVESLMQPPTLTDLQTQVDSALRDAVGDSFILKYPERGQYRSGYNFIDIDGDKVDEAIAFVSHGDETLQLALLRQEDGRWFVSDLVPGLAFSSEVDFVSVEQLGSQKRLLVGWGSTGRVNNLLTLYRYTSVGGAPSALTVDSRWDYSQVSAVDIDRNGASELLLLLASDNYENTTPTAQLVGESAEGVIELLAETELARNIVSYHPPVVGNLGDGLYGIAADCVLGNGKLYTIAISYIDGKLLLPLDEGDLSRTTTRTQSVLSCDLNGDGTIDIPVALLAQGYTEGAADAVYFVDYSNLVDKALVPVQRAYVNLSRGWRLLMPKEWDEHPVSALVQPDNSEVIFFINTTGNLYDHSKELLRIQTSSTLDGQDKLSGDRYIQLAAKGTYIYSAALSGSSIGDLRLSRDYLEQAFTLIN